LSDSLYHESSAINVCVKTLAKKIQRETGRDLRVKVLDVMFNQEKSVWIIKGEVLLKSVMGIDNVGKLSFLCSVNDYTGTVESLSIEKK